MMVTTQFNIIFIIVVKCVPVFFLHGKAFFTTFHCVLSSTYVCFHSSAVSFAELYVFDGVSDYFGDNSGWRFFHCDVIAT